MSQQTPTVPNDDPLRLTLHAMWSAVAPAWERHAEFSDVMTADTTHAMLTAAQLEPGSHVLELACGAGGVGLAAARVVGPGGEVTISDVVPEMVAIARERADRASLANVRTRVLDLEEIALPDRSFDAVVCREGLMLVPDPARAAAEMRRVLRPGGRAVVSVWGPRAHNPWLGVIFDAVSAELGAPMPPAGLPGPFALDDADLLGDVLRDGGWQAVGIDDIPTAVHAASKEQWWDRTVALAGPLGGMLAALPPGQSRAIRDRALGAVANYERGDGTLELPGVAFVAGGHA